MWVIFSILQVTAAGTKRNQFVHDANRCGFGVWNLCDKLLIFYRLYQKQLNEQEAAFQQKRKMQMGSAGRSEKIRTYNYSQDRITDHRGPITFHNVPLFLSGTESFDDLLNTLILQSRLMWLNAVISEFVETSKIKN